MVAISIFSTINGEGDIRATDLGLMVRQTVENIHVFIRISLIADRGQRGFRLGTGGSNRASGRQQHGQTCCNMRNDRSGLDD